MGRSLPALLYRRHSPLFCSRKPAGMLVHNGILAFGGLELGKAGWHRLRLRIGAGATPGPSGSLCETIFCDYSDAFHGADRGDVLEVEPEAVLDVIDPAWVVLGWRS